MKLRAVVVVIAVGLGIAMGCSKKSDGTSEGSSGGNELTDSLSVLSSSISSIEGLAPNVSASFVPGEWEDGIMWDPESDDGTPLLSIPAWLAKQLASSLPGTDRHANFLLRLQNSFDKLCTFGAAIPAQGSRLKLGTHNLTMNQGLITRINSVCGEDLDSEVLGMEFTIAVAEPDDTTLYDRYVEIQMDGDVSGVYLRSTNNQINIASGELTSRGEIRVLINYNRSSGELRFEYISAANDDNSFYIYRLFVDEDADLATALIHEGGGTRYHRYSLVGRPEAGGEVALNLMREYDDVDDFADKRGCVGVAAGDLANSTLSCAGGVTGVALSDTGNALVDAAFAEGDTLGWADVDATSGVVFTDATDLFTEAVQTP